MDGHKVRRQQNPIAVSKVFGNNLDLRLVKRCVLMKRRTKLTCNDKVRTDKVKESILQEQSLREIQKYMKQMKLETQGYLPQIPSKIKQMLLK